ncbi:hypothetical protein T492DRAFT_1050363 [Pavlovales sp. CCMP2436]|nr:hypothetical protein T492DRAFT_1050363 [Pavlovales sp. CCMP2436]
MELSAAAPLIRYSCLCPDGGLFAATRVMEPIDISELKLLGLIDKGATSPTELTCSGVVRLLQTIGDGMRVLPSHNCAAFRSEIEETGEGVGAIGRALGYLVPLACCAPAPIDLACAACASGATLPQGQLVKLDKIKQKGFTSCKAAIGSAASQVASNQRAVLPYPATWAELSCKALNHAYTKNAPTAGLRGAIEKDCCVPASASDTGEPRTGLLEPPATLAIGVIAGIAVGAFCFLLGPAACVGYMYRANRAPPKVALRAELTPIAIAELSLPSQRGPALPGARVRPPLEMPRPLSQWAVSAEKVLPNRIGDTPPGAETQAIVLSARRASRTIGPASRPVRRGSSAQLPPLGRRDSLQGDINAITPRRLERRGSLPPIESQTRNGHGLSPRLPDTWPAGAMADGFERGGYWLASTPTVGRQPSIANSPLHGFAPKVDLDESKLETLGGLRSATVPIPITVLSPSPSRSPPQLAALARARAFALRARMVAAAAEQHDFDEGELATLRNSAAAASCGPSVWGPSEYEDEVEIQPLNRSTTDSTRRAAPEPLGSAPTAPRSLNRSNYAGRDM